MIKFSSGTISWIVTIFISIIGFAVMWGGAVVRIKKLEKNQDKKMDIDNHQLICQASTSDMKLFIKDSLDNAVKELKKEFRTNGKS